MIIRTEPNCEADVAACKHNVSNRIKALGGKAVYGWCIVDYGKYLVKNNHCVWQNEIGELVDVTPTFVADVGEIELVKWPKYIEFEPDSEAVFDVRALLPKYIPKTGDSKLAKACDYMQRRDAALIAKNIEAGRYWSNKANLLLRQIGALECNTIVPDI